MQKGLLSVITPCYNTGHLVSHLLDSILIQDYPQIEMFVVDDGSTDETSTIIQSYIPKFEEKGYSLRYIYQKNQGQSVAMNQALPLCQGEFLTWPDSDDYLNDSHLYSSMVQTLNESSESVSSVRCIPIFVSEETKKEIGRKVWNSTKTDIFEGCLFNHNDFWFPPVCYMVKMSVLDQVVPTRNIYTEKNAGQNWQLMLPLFYKRQCLTLPNYGACVLERAASHSRGQYRTYQQVSAKYMAYQRTIVETLKRMGQELDPYILRINQFFLELQISIASNEGTPSDVRHFYNLLKKDKSMKISSKYKTLYFMSFIPWHKRIIDFLRNFK